MMLRAARGAHRIETIVDRSVGVIADKVWNIVENTDVQELGVFVLPLAGGAVNSTCYECSVDSSKQ